MRCMRTNGETMVACNDYDVGEEGGHMGRIQYRSRERSFTCVRIHDQDLVVGDDFVRLLVVKL